MLKAYRSMFARTYEQRNPTFLYHAHWQTVMNRTFSSIREYARQSLTPKSCTACNGPATKDVLFDVGNGIAVIERYCAQCAELASNNSVRGSA